MSTRRRVYEDRDTYQCKSNKESQYSTTMFPGFKALKQRVYVVSELFTFCRTLGESVSVP